MRLSRTVRIRAALSAIVALAPFAAADDARSTGQFLLDLARDHGLSAQGRQKPADVEQIRTLLQAATRLEPDLGEAYVWLHELAVLRGDERAAAAAVRQLVQADPTSATAFSLWLQAYVNSVETVEERLKLLDRQLETAPANRTLRALIHVEIAQQALARLDYEMAEEHLIRARALDEALPIAARLQFELLRPAEPVAERLKVALRYLALNPSDLSAAWQIGNLLDGQGFRGEAGMFYQHVQRLWRRLRGDEALPAAYLHDLAHHALAVRAGEEAIRYTTEAIAADPALAGEGGMFLYWLIHSRGHAAEAKVVRGQLEQRFAEVREPGDWPVNEVAQAAWYHLTIDPQPQRALMLAQNAAARVADDPFVQRVLGWALAANLNEAEAEQLLAPLAREDVYAAAALAHIYSRRGEEAAARRVIEDLPYVPEIGPAAQKLAEIGLEAPATQPAGQRYPEISAVLSRFDRTTLQFHSAPQQFLQVGLRVPQRTVEVGAPWWVELSITNRAQFPISLGPEWMLNPVFLLSLELDGDRQRAYPHLLTISIDGPLVIRPGETVSVRRTIDLGPVRRVDRRTPQQLQRVTVRALLDPVRTAGGAWQQGPAGIQLDPVYFNRLPAAGGRETVNVLYAALQGKAQTSPRRAAEVLAELLSEQQRAALGRLSYRPTPIPVEQLTRGLIAALRSESWEVRVRALDGLLLAGLDRALLAAAEENLNHPHWLVRLMAVRFFGQRQIEPGAATLQQFAESDENELVRAMAASFQAAESEAGAAGGNGTAASPAGEQDEPPTTQPGTDADPPTARPH